MPCYHPVRAYQPRPGAKLVHGVVSGLLGGRFLERPCGSCIGCRLEYARQWAVRCMHEAKMHEENCGITLTYDDEHLPPGLVLRRRDYELFFKRLRESLRRNSRPLIRDFMCGEYGEKYSRPHYHAIIFGFYPVDAVYYGLSKTKLKLYTSKYLDSVWRNGAVYVSNADFEYASYIARYILKKNKDGSKEREILDVTSGEIITRPHEYGKMSKRPAGLGASFVAKYGSDIFPYDRVMVRNLKSPVPRYYNTLLDRHSPLYHAVNKSKREEKSVAKYLQLLQDRPDLKWSDPRRLDVEEYVKKAQIKSLKRS